MFRPKSYFVDRYGMDVRTVERRFEWIRKHPERYQVGTVSKNEGKTYCQDYAFEDMIANKGKVDAGLNPKLWREQRV